MGRPFAKSLSLFFLILAWSSCVFASRTLEEQVQQLREDNVEIKDVLGIKVTRLEAQVAQLEIKVQEQHEELLKMKLQSERADRTVVFTSDVVENQAAGKSNILRTCRETRAADPSLSSGMYWIDPDGQGIGDDPIYVYCDMNSGSTAVLHDSESQMDVGHCADPGCYSRVINYSATKRQMIALAELSNECHQSIKYDCISAPLEINGITYSWWNDRNENSQYFWSGSDSAVHTCQCGIENNCVEATVPCNCDSGLPTLLADSGVITDKNFLPVTRLNFGRTILESSSGIHTLGRFECTGQVAVNGMPTSCDDLWKIGHTLSGLYSVMGAEMVETIYCDFTKLPTEPNFESRIGFSDVKSSPIYFYVEKNTNFNATKTPIPFEIERLNVGKAMNLSSGIFTASQSGIYFFSLSGMSRALEGTSNGNYIRIDLLVNGSVFSRAYTDNNNHHKTFSLQATLNLQAGDEIWLVIDNLTDAYFYGGFYTHFTGWLLQETFE